jgi:predicted ATPase/class 3 adenylate cyclase/Tfp pilus assembly protein PilF
MSSQPSGTVTFLFTDIEGSAKRWEAYPQQMQSALTRHNSILSAAIGQHGGYVFKTVGDAYCAAFSSPHDALVSALQAQVMLHNEEWPQEVGQLKVRMALHTGVVKLQEEDYFGQPLNRVARLLSTGHGEQILLSDPTYDLVRDNLPPSITVRDLGEHRLKDLIRPERIFQLVTPPLPAEFPPLRTLDTRPNNLTVQLTHFIGRETEVEAISTLVSRPETHLVTLTGPGGMGKTRLALQVGAELVDADGFPDGVWFVELAALTDPHLVASTIAQAIGVAEMAGKPLMESLKEHIKEKRMLLVLDNFEHLQEAASLVDALLKAAPHIKVLATSRVPLRVYGEKEYPVPPLGLPPTGAWRAIPLQQLSQYEAVRLFIERAQDVKPDFEVSNDNAPAVAEICARLDGLPLALELAAARVRLFSPQALLSRLSSRLKMLTGGARTLPARQQTLRAAIEWSYDLLSEGEKQLFRRMAVFQGGRSLEALEAVCNHDGQLEIDVLEGVESLVAKSLLQQREGSDGEPRFWMLETIHEYAREKLEESNEREILAREHALYFMRLSEEGELHIRGPKDRLYYDKFEDELENIRAALRWSLDEANPEIGVRLAASVAMARFWVQRMHVTEGRAWIAQLLARPELAAKMSLRAKALHCAGSLADNWGEMMLARTYYEEASVICREVGDERELGRALNGIGWVCVLQGDLISARMSLEEAVVIRRRVGDMREVGTSLEGLAALNEKDGHHAASRAFHQQALAIWRSLGDKGGVANVSNNWGELEKHMRNYAEAQVLFEQAIPIAREERRPKLIANALTNLSHLLVKKGDLERAQQCLVESLTLRKEQGGKMSIAESLLGWADLAIARDQAQRAGKLLGAVDHLLQESGATLWPTDQDEYEQCTNAARSQLGEDGFERLRSEGRAMSMEEAIEYALES